MVNQFRLVAIKERIRLDELERQDLLRMVTRSQVPLAWISERMECIETELHFLYRDLNAEEQNESRWN